MLRPDLYSERAVCCTLFDPIFRSFHKQLTNACNETSNRTKKNQDIRTSKVRWEAPVLCCGSFSQISAGWSLLPPLQRTTSKKIGPRLTQQKKKSNTIQYQFNHIKGCKIRRFRPKKMNLWFNQIKHPKKKLLGFLKPQNNAFGGWVVPGKYNEIPCPKKIKQAPLEVSSAKTKPQDLGAAGWLEETWQERHSPFQTLCKASQMIAGEMD